jgi:hypothetical protein
MGRPAVVTLPQCIDRSNVDQAGATASQWTVTGIPPGADHRQHPA